MGGGTRTRSSARAASTISFKLSLQPSCLFLDVGVSKPEFPTELPARTAGPVHCAAELLALVWRGTLECMMKMMHFLL